MKDEYAGETGENMKIVLNVNGFLQEADYEDDFVQDVLMPVLKDLSDLFHRKQKRLIVFLAGPPAAGKSTLALFLEKLSLENDSLARVQALSMDGFHYPNAYLDTHETVRDGVPVLLRTIKGSPETYDTAAIGEALRQICRDRNAGMACTYKWPAYDRTIHDVVPGKYAITGEILLIEGNYLLLEEPSWKELREYADETIFVQAPEEKLKDRLVNRKIRGGSSRWQAEDWVAHTDTYNIERVLNGSVKAGYQIRV